MWNVIGHLKTILLHKFWVFVYCCKLGIPWQGITHDMSKFSWTEFSESVRYYQGGKESPIPSIKKQGDIHKRGNTIRGETRITMSIGLTTMTSGRLA